MSSTSLTTDQRGVVRTGLNLLVELN